MELTVVLDDSSVVEASLDDSPLDLDSSVVDDDSLEVVLLVSCDSDDDSVEVAFSDSDLLDFSSLLSSSLDLASPSEDFESTLHNNRSMTRFVRNECLNSLRSIGTPLVRRRLVSSGHTVVLAGVGYWGRNDNANESSKDNEFSGEEAHRCESVKLSIAGEQKCVKGRCQIGGGKRSSKKRRRTQE
jgi:hypothetical protein